MIIRIVSFTKAGDVLAKKTESLLPEHIFEFFCVENSAGSTDGIDGGTVGEFISESFRHHFPLVFVGAVGIAVRLICSFVESKLSDSPVIVMDEKGKHVIPILSGHVGGANRIARLIAERTGANTVITTATDVNGIFSVDEFACDNGLEIINKDGIKKVSAKLLSGQEASVFLDEGIIQRGEGCFVRASSADDADLYISTDRQRAVQSKAILKFYLKKYCAGIGCKKETPLEQIENFVRGNLPPEILGELFCIGTIDLKARERGLVAFAHSIHAQLKIYSARQLEDVQGTSSSSEFVKSVTGVDNVCERGAICAAGEGAVLVRNKIAGGGVTVAVAQRRSEIFWS